MTPTTIIKPTTITAAGKHNLSELAAQPLTFTTERFCTSKAIKAAIIDALTDKSRSDQCIAAIFNNAWQHRYLAELNQLIRNIETQHGPGTVLINSNVVRLLADEGIILQQNGNGTVQLEKFVAVKSDLKRQLRVQSALLHILPGSLCQLINAYDDEIEIGDLNRDEIMAIFDSGNPAAKSAVIAAASHQRQIPWLNALFNEQLGKHHALNLSHVDLSNLDLTGIDLTQANISFANLHNCCLVDAQLSDALFIASNLNNANLSGANLTHAYLSQTRLVAANLYQATLRGAILSYACLLCANLEQADLGYNMDLALTVLNFSNMNNVLYAQLKSFGHNVRSPIDVMVVRRLPETSSHTDFSSTQRVSYNLPASSSRKEAILIDENERELLLTKGIVMKNNSDGTGQLRRELTVRQDRLRHKSIDATLEPIFPKALTDLISSYDDDIEISEQNEEAILEILKSTDQTSKALVIASASRQLNIRFLNLQFLKLQQLSTTLDLSGIDLSNLHLPGINLSFVNLSGANLQGCYLYEAVLNHADLRNTNLNSASLVSANLSYADMRFAGLFQANLANAVLINVKLANANLTSANMRNADLTGRADLTNACLDHADLSWTRLTDAVMIGSSLRHAHMYGTGLSQANLTDAKLMHARMRHATLRGVNLTRADLSGAKFQDITLIERPNLTGTIWTGASVSEIIADPKTRALLPDHLRLACLE